MTERRYSPFDTPAVSRPPTFNPARTSMPAMPSTMGYNPVYPGDIHSYSTAPSLHTNGGSSRYYHSTGPHPRAHGSAANTVANDPTPRSSRPREVVPTSTRTRRSSTLDATSHRPIIITTTAPNGHTHGHNPARERSRSPTRDDHRPADPTARAPRGTAGSGSMSRPGLAPPYSPTFDANDDEFMSRIRGPEIVPASSRADSYRASRPTVVYPSNPRHTAVDIGDQYGYTKPGDLAQYDLEHPKSTRQRHQDSFDHYARPNIYYNPERRGFNIETNRTPHDNTNGLSTKPTEARGGPPPTTWGLDKLNRSSTYEPLSVPPPAPVPPPPHRADATSTGPRERRGSNRHAQPISLYQEAPPRSARDDEFYRSRDGERSSRKERDLDQGLYIDDSVGARGFGIRTGPMPEADDRRERRERVQMEYADSTHRVEDGLDHDWDHIGRVEVREFDDGKERRRTRKPRSGGNDGGEGLAADRGDTEPESGKRMKDGLKAGLGIAASALGLGSIASKNGRTDVEEDRERPRERLDKPESNSKERHRKGPEDERTVVFSSEDDDVEIISAHASGRYHPREKGYVSKDHRDCDRIREQGRVDQTESSPARNGADHSGSREHHPPRDADGATADNRLPKTSRDDSRSDEEDDRPRRRGRLPAFNPNDTKDLNDIKKELATMDIHDKDDDGKRVAVVDPVSDSQKDVSRRERSISSRRDPSSSRIRDVVLSAPEGKAVRVVSPPPHDRVSSDSKPRKGILKAPSSKFPEDPNPIREGVAPHKNDEKLREVPQGARWTRISRKIVNPDALAVGKERFEVRDDFVIVLRVLSREEIESYAAATAVLRERKRKEVEKAKKDGSGEDENEDERRRRRRYRDREDYDEEALREEGDKGAKKIRRRRYDEEEGLRDEGGHKRHEQHHHKRHREREGGS